MKSLEMKSFPLLLMLLVLLAVGSTWAAPDASHQAARPLQVGEGARRRTWPLLYMDILMNDPFGVKPVEPVCKDPQEQCSLTDPGACCSGICEYNGVDRNECCVAPDGDCEDLGDCCSGSCNQGKCPTYARVHTPCLGGSATVRILEPPGVAALKDVKVGQHVQCLNSDDEMRLPTTLTYCEVKDWVHADEELQPMIHLTFRRPDGSTHNMAAANFIAKLDANAPTVAAPVRQAGAIAPFTAVLAKEVAVGDKILVLADEASPTSGFVAATVTAIDIANDTSYLPAIDKPYMVVDGVVAPVWVKHRAPLDSPLTGADQAAQHYLYAPLWMSRLQPLGTPAAGARSSGPGLAPSYVREAADINKAKEHHAKSGLALSYAAVRAWFQPRYAAWKADPSKAITEADVLEFLHTDAAWVRRAN